MPTDKTGVDIEYVACFEGGAKVRGMQDEAARVTTDDRSILGPNIKFVKQQLVGSIDQPGGFSPQTR